MTDGPIADAHGVRRVIRGATVIGAFGLAIKVVAFAKEIVVASAFGRADALESFLIALVLPSIVATVVGGSFRTAFIPVYVRTRSVRGRSVADRLFVRAAILAVGVVAVASAVLAWSAPAIVPIIAGGYDAEKTARTVELLRVLAPFAVLSALPLIVAGVHESLERFGVVSVAQVGVPALTLIAVLSVGSRFGAAPLVVGVVFGWAIESGALLVAWRRAGHGLGEGTASTKTELRAVVGQWFPAAAAMVFQDLMGVVDQAMAAHLSSGSVAALSYAWRIVSLPLGLATLAIGNALLPVLSDLHARGSREAFWRTAARAVRVGLWGGAVVAAVLFVTARPIVRTVYEGGAFGSEDTAVVAAVLAAYAGMTPFFVAGVLGVRVVNSLGMNRLLFYLGGFNLTVNVVGNLVLSRWIGLPGIALSTVVVYAAAGAIVFVALGRRRRREQVDRPA